MKNKKIFILTLLISLCAFNAFAQIAKYDVLLEPQKDASMIITETFIPVYSESYTNDYWYRDLCLGNNVRYEILSIEVNNKKQNFNTKLYPEFLRVSFDKNNTQSQPVIAIKYKISNKFVRGFNTDILNWRIKDNNMIAMQTNFNITVKLDNNMQIVSSKAFATFNNNKIKNVRIYQSDKILKLSSNLEFGSILNLKVKVKKGFFQFPLIWNIKFFSILFSSILLLYSMYRFWRKILAQPKFIKVNWQLAPYNHLTASKIKYIYDRASNNTILLTPSILQMKLRGFLKVKKDKGKYLYTHDINVKPQNEEEKLFLQTLGEGFELNADYSPKLAIFQKKLQKCYKKELNKKFFVSTKRTIFKRYATYCLTAAFLFFLSGNMIGLPYFLLWFSSFLLGIFLIKSETSITRIFGFFVYLYAIIQFSYYTYNIDNPDIKWISLLFWSAFIASIIEGKLLYYPTRKGLKIIGYLQSIKSFLYNDDPQTDCQVTIEQMEEMMIYAIIIKMENKWIEKTKRLFPNQESLFNGEVKMDDLADFISSTRILTQKSCSSFG